MIARPSNELKPSAFTRRILGLELVPAVRSIVAPSTLSGSMSSYIAPVSPASSPNRIVPHPGTLVPEYERPSRAARESDEVEGPPLGGPSHSDRRSSLSRRAVRIAVAVRAATLFVTRARGVGKGGSRHHQCCESAQRHDDLFRLAQLRTPPFKEAAGEMQRQDLAPLSRRSQWRA